jgi:hypothetical protein
MSAIKQTTKKAVAVSVAVPDKQGTELPDEVDAFDEDAQSLLDMTVVPEYLDCGGMEIAGVRCRQVTMATIVMLRRLGNSLVAGVELKDIKDPLGDAGQFLALQREEITVQDAAKLSGDSTALDNAALEILDTVSPHYMASLFPQCIQAIRDSMITKVQAKPPRDMEDTLSELEGNE